MLKLLSFEMLSLRYVCHRVHSFASLRKITETTEDFISVIFIVGLYDTSRVSRLIAAAIGAENTYM